MSFFADGEWFAADVGLVQKCARNIELTPVPMAPGEVAGIANDKGKVVTLLRIAVLLQRSAPARALPRRINAVIFKSSSGNVDQMGLVVTRPGDLIDIDDAKIVPPPLEEGAEAARYISGVAEQDGMIYRILNMEAIIERFRSGAKPQGGIADEKPL